MPTPYTTRRGQSAYDAIITACGQIDNLFEIFLANPSLSLTSDPAPKTIILIPDGLVTPPNIASSYKAAKFDVNNSGEPVAPLDLLNEDGTVLLNEDGQSLLNEL